LFHIDSTYPEILASIRDTKDLTADNEKALGEAITKFLKGFATS
jgi:F-type H+-transporting ATPase subunit alpha